MEEELGALLFDRSFRQLELTDAGKALLQNATQVLQAYQNLTSELNDVIDLKKGEIKIGIPPIIGAAFCSKLISHYIELFPFIDVSLVEVGSKKIKDGILNGTLDIGFVCNKPINKKEIETIQLVKDPLMAVVHTTHPLQKKPYIEMDDLKDEAFIMYRQDFSLFDGITNACSINGFYPNIVCESSQKDFILEMVKAKLGIALLPSQICDSITNEQIIALPFQTPTIYLELGMIWKKNNYLSYSVREFIAAAKSISF